MKRLLVRYTVKPEAAEANVTAIEAVFAELAEKAPDGVRYAAFRGDDGVSFYHLATVETADGANPLAALDAFKTFREGLKERCAEPPRSVELGTVGSYRVFGD